MSSATPMLLHMLNRQNKELSRQRARQRVTPRPSQSQTQPKTQSQDMVPNPLYVAEKFICKYLLDPIFK